MVLPKHRVIFTKKISMAELAYLPIKTKHEIKKAVADIAHNNRTSASKWVSDLLEKNADVQAQIKKSKKKSK